MRLIAIPTAVLVASTAGPAHAITIGQIETFQEPSGWTGGQSVSLVTSGGPSGAGDAYLRASSTGAPSNLFVFTRQWSGDYIEAGVTAIQADLINLGTAELQMRFHFAATPSNSLFMASTPAILPADGSWRHVEFDLDDMIPDAAEALRNVGSIGFIHQVSITGDFGTPVTGSFGIDNITVVPEPTSLVIASFGAAFCLRRH